MDYEMYRLQISMVPVETQALKFRKLLSCLWWIFTFNNSRVLKLSLSLWHTQRHVPFLWPSQHNAFIKRKEEPRHETSFFRKRNNVMFLSINCISIFACTPELRVCSCKLILILFLYEGQFFVAFVQIWRKYFLLACLWRDTAAFVRYRPCGDNCFPLQ